MSSALKVPKNRVASIIRKWKKFGNPKTHPRAGHPAKLSNQGCLGLLFLLYINDMKDASYIAVFVSKIIV
jgi:hypothetical protein